MEPPVPAPPVKVGKSFPQRIHDFTVLMVQIALPVGTILYLAGSWVVQRYYDRFALSPSDVGVTEFDLMMTAAGQALVLTPLVGAAVVLSLGVWAMRRGGSRLAGLGVVMLLVLVGLYWVFAGTAGHAADDTKQGDPASPWFSSLPEPRGVRLRDAGSDCMMLLGTHEGVWMIWNVKEQQLERHSTDSDVLISCTT